MKYETVTLFWGVYIFFWCLCVCVCVCVSLRYRARHACNLNVAAQYNGPQLTVTKSVLCQGAVDRQTAQRRQQRL